MMYSYSFFDDFSHCNNRRKQSVLLVQNFKGSVVNSFYPLFLYFSGQVIFGANRFSVGLHLFFAETEDNYRIKLSLNDYFYYFR